MTKLHELKVNYSPGRIDSPDDYIYSPCAHNSFTGARQITACTGTGQDTLTTFYLERKTHRTISAKDLLLCDPTVIYDNVNNWRYYFYTCANFLGRDNDVAWHRERPATPLKHNTIVTPKFLGLNSVLDGDYGVGQPAIRKLDDGSYLLIATQKVKDEGNRIRAWWFKMTKTGPSKMTPAGILNNDGASVDFIVRGGTLCVLVAGAGMVGWRRYILSFGPADGQQGYYSRSTGLETVYTSDTGSLSCYGMVRRPNMIDGAGIELADGNGAFVWQGTKSGPELKHWDLERFWMQSPFAYPL